VAASHAPKRLELVKRAAHAAAISIEVSRRAPFACSGERVEQRFADLVLATSSAA
jgi:hypothetical protein